MSNVAQFFGQGHRIGETVSLPYNGDSFTATDGTVWKAVNAKALAYSSTYSNLLTNAPLMVTAATQLNGPFADNYWNSYQTGGIVGATTGGATWLMMGSNTSTNVDFYYTSTNAGSTWTQRTPPVAAKSWITLWDGTNFVAYASGTTTNGVQNSTDGVTWTPQTAISVSNPSDFLYNGSVYLVMPSSGTTAATSSDLVTWTSRTLATSVSFATVLTPGTGTTTWNAGAGLFITGSGTNGTYQTSPDGATWTNRTALNTEQALLVFGSTTRFASDATTTVAVGISGVVATTTNGTSWTIQGTVDTGFYPGSNTTSGLLYHDGTRFVSWFRGITYYSTDGATWTRNSRGSFPNITGAMRIPGGVATQPGATMQVCYQMSDMSSTTATNILHPGPVIDAATRTYVRIL